MADLNRLIIYIGIFLALPIVVITKLKLKLPEITVLQIMKNDEYNFIKIEDIEKSEREEFYTKTDNDIIMTSAILAIVLKCSASYPVYWTVEQSEDLSLDTAFDLITTTGRSGSIDEPQDNWEYWSILKFWVLTQQLTRNYTCRAVHDEHLQTSTFLFSPGSSQTYLVQAGKKFNVGVDAKATIDLPCAISTIDNDIEVKLWKEEIEIAQPFNVSTWKIIPKNESIKYDPRRGFTFIVRDLPDIFAMYRCTANDDNEDDVVHFNIVPTSEKVDEENLLRMRLDTHGSAKLYYQYDHNYLESIVCCSNSDQPPKFTVVSCNNPSHCGIYTRSLALAKTDNKELYWWYGGQKNLTKNCTEGYSHLKSFLLKCKGDGVDIFSQFYYSYSFDNMTTLKKYLGSGAHTIAYEIIPVSTKVTSDRLIVIVYTKDWHWDFQNQLNEISDSYMPLYSEEQNVADNRMFSGQRYTFQCFPSTYIFGNGAFWEILWKNGTKKRFLGLGGGDIYHVDYDNSDMASISLIVDENMSSISCIPPFWNSTEWATKSLDLTVTVPTFAQASINSDLEEIYWTVNDTNRKLECSFFGEPTPQIFWKKDGMILHSSEIFSIKDDKKTCTSALQFLQIITHDVHGYYSCTGLNLAGSATRNFLVAVQEDDSTHALVITGVIFVLLIVLGALGVIAWKTQFHRKILQNMRASTFETGI